MTKTIEIKTSNIKNTTIRRNNGLVSKEVATAENRLKFKPSNEKTMDNAKLITVIIDAKMGMELRLAFKVEFFIKDTLNFLPYCKYKEVE